MLHAKYKYRNQVYGNSAVTITTQTIYYPEDNPLLFIQYQWIFLILLLWGRLNGLSDILSSVSRKPRLE